MVWAASAFRKKFRPIGHSTNLVGSLEHSGRIIIGRHPNFQSYHGQNFSFSVVVLQDLPTFLLHAFFRAASITLPQIAEKNEAEPPGGSTPDKCGWMSYGCIAIHNLAL